MNTRDSFINYLRRLFFFLRVLARPDNVILSLLYRLHLRLLLAHVCITAFSSCLRISSFLVAFFLNVFLIFLYISRYGVTGNTLLANIPIIFPLDIRTTPPHLFLAWAHGLLLHSVTGHMHL